MFGRIPEKSMHLVRWVLVIGWLLLIISLFYDPVTPHLTAPEATWSFLHLDPRLLDPKLCHEVLEVQGECLSEAPYALGAKVFWGMVIPCGVMILLVFGHELWRRICPLSFLSQIPRSLGWQRKSKIVNSRTGKVRYEIVKIKKNSWLARNHLYLQFAVLCTGLIARILFLNSHRIVLGSFLLLTIFSAILVGYLFGGKSWCQYFCPMAPVQLVYEGPRSLLGSEAHQGPKQTITQSMCRIVEKDGKEKSACVGCQSPCVDIDAERSYWEVINKPGRKLVQYGYVGLVIGFYIYYLLYSGTLNYYYSGAWNHEENQLETLLNPGFYINNTAIPIPKLIAVPLTIIVFVAFSYWGFSKLEKAYRAYTIRKNQKIDKKQIQHRIFSLCTFLVFNIYFMFGGRPILKLLLSPPLELGFNGLIMLLSTVWLYRTLFRSNEAYTKESLANSLRRQLGKLSIDFSKFLEGRSLEELKPNELYVLARVLPNVSSEYGTQVYKGLLKEALDQGNVDSANSLDLLSQIRLELKIEDQEHFAILTELGIEDPDLLDPGKKRTRENQLRIESYRQALEQQLLALIEMGIPVQEALQRKEKQIRALKLEYSITTEEETKVLSELLEPNSTILRTAEGLLAQLKKLKIQDQVLSDSVDGEITVFILLREIAVSQKQKIFAKKLLSILAILGDAPEVEKIARSLALLAENVLPELLQQTHQLSPQVLALLTTAPSSEDDLASEPKPGIIDVLTELMQELDLPIGAASLHALAQIDLQSARKQARELLNTNQGNMSVLVRETATNLLSEETSRRVSTLDKLLLLFDTSFFRSLNTDALIELARNAQIRVHPSGVILCQEGDYSNEILVLVSGSADVTVRREDRQQLVGTIGMGETIGEMGVLTHQKRSATVTTTGEENRVLVIDADNFELVLRQDWRVAKNIMLVLTSRIKKLTNQINS